MSQPDLYAIFDECVSRLSQGESPEACLADHPSHAGELTLDLTLAAELIHLSPLEPSPEAVENGYQKMMGALDSGRKLSPLAGLSALTGRLLAPLGRRPRGLAGAALRVAAIGIIILVAAGSLVVTASAGTLPGDALYPVKRSWENARLSLTINDSSRQALRSEFERRRLEEVQAVVDLRRPVVVEFKGVVESIGGDVWQVNGLDLHVTNETQIDGAVSVGLSVAVRAQVQEDGSLAALNITVDESRPATGATPRPTSPPTRPTRPPQTAAAPSPTLLPEETRPEATATATPTERPAPEPTSTLAPSLDRDPTREPTREPKPTDTRSNDSLATAVPSDTKTPTETDDPTPTSRPADLASPTPTPTPTSQATRDVKPPTPTPTATRNTDSAGQNDRPP
jgi:hypothetical protein